MSAVKFFCFTLFASAVVHAQQEKCKVSKDVMFILNNMTALNVKKAVDCVVGIGACDTIGNRLKGEAGNAVRQGRCNKDTNACNCNQIQVRLVVNKVKRNFSSEWQRVVDFHSK